MNMPDFDGKFTSHGISSIRSLTYMPNAIYGKEYTAVKVYPNPASGILNVDIGNLKRAVLKIFNIQGQLVHSKNLAGRVSEIDINSLQVALYYVQIETDDFKVVRKLVKE